MVILTSQGQGSGVIYRSDGYILTNQHVVGSATTVTVRIPSGSGQRSVTGAVLGSNAIRDLAVVKVNETNLAFANFGDSNSLQIGTEVIALGYPLGQTSSVTVTRGILSRRVVDAELGELLQTDAAINPGNSGGPLVTLSGQVIGINQSGLINTSRGEIAQGIGFALAISGAQAVVSSLESGTVVASSNLTYTNTARNYYFSYPSSWQINSSNINSIRVSNTAGAALDSITYVNTAASYADLNTLRQFIIDTESPSLTGFLVTSSQTVTLTFKNGTTVNGVLLNYTGAQQGTSFTLRTYAYRVGTTIYWIRYSASTSAFSSYLPTFDEIFTSWEFIS